MPTPIPRLRTPAALWSPDIAPRGRFYAVQIQPRLVEITSSVLSSALGVSRQYAVGIRAGRRPDPIHWLSLARLVGVSLKQ